MSRSQCFYRSFLFFAFFSATQVFAINKEPAKQTQPANMEKEAKTKLNIESFDWQGNIPESRLVVVKNLYGSIRSRNHGDEQIFLHATFQEIGERPLRPEFEIHEANDKLYINVVYPQSVLDEQGNLRGRTDISILFPNTVSIHAETDSGLIKIDKTESHVEAITQSGEINLTTTGLFSAQSQSGKIKLRLRGFKQHGQSIAKTETGTIQASVFNDMAINLTAQTDGKIRLNDEKKLAGLVLQQGANGLQTNLSSQTGNIEIQVIAPPELVHSTLPANVRPAKS